LFLSQDKNNEKYEPKIAKFKKKKQKEETEMKGTKKINN
jgi:hypothetical protein